jgi:hypothetical protein
MDNERKLPKQAFDSEYMTEFLREVRFLTEKGIKYTFVRKTQDYGISQYKYRKTPALFAALVEFYATIEAERNIKKSAKKGGTVATMPEPSKEEYVLSHDEIKKAQEILEKAAKQIEAAQEEKDDTI